MRPDLSVLITFDELLMFNKDVEDMQKSLYLAELSIQRQEQLLIEELNRDEYKESEDRNDGGRRETRSSSNA